MKIVLIQGGCAKPNSPPPLYTSQNGVKTDAWFPELLKLQHLKIAFNNDILFLGRQRRELVVATVLTAIGCTLYRVFH